MTTSGPLDDNPTHADLLQLISRLRHQQLLQERSTANNLINSYQATWQSLLSQQDHLLQQIAAERAAGQSVSPSQLYRAGRMSLLERQIHQQLGQFGQSVQSYVGQAMQRSAFAGRQGALDLVNANMQGIFPGDVGNVFAKLNTRPVEQIVRSEGSGGTLDQLTNKLSTEFSPEAATAMKTELKTGVALGKAPKQIARNMRKAIPTMPLTRALMISRTESIRAFNMGALDNYQANADVVGQYEISVAADCCDECADYEGETFDLDDLENLPPYHPNCRCAAVPVTNSLSDIMNNLGMDGSWFDDVDADFEDAFGGGEEESSGGGAAGGSSGATTPKDQQAAQPSVDVGDADPDVKFITEADVPKFTQGNAEGVPDVGYHFTSQPSADNINAHGVDLARGADSRFGQGFYMVSERVNAGYGGVVIRAALHMQNPFVFASEAAYAQFKADLLKEHPEWVSTAEGVGRWGTKLSDSEEGVHVTETLRARGYDGILIHDPMYNGLFHVLAIKPGTVRVINDGAANKEAAERQPTETPKEPTIRPIEKLGDGTIVDMPPDASEKVATLLHRPLTPQQLAAVSGAQPGDRVRVVPEPKYNRVRLDLIGPRYNGGAAYLGTRWVYADAIGRLQVLDGLFTNFDHSPLEFKRVPRIFVDQVRALRELKATEILIHAGPKDYWALARVGLDGPLTKAQIAQLPLKYQGAKTVQDLMSAPGGSVTWQKIGKAFEGHFDLTDGSPSMVTLGRFLKETINTPAYILGPETAKEVQKLIQASKGVPLKAQVHPSDLGPNITGIETAKAKKAGTPQDQGVNQFANTGKVKAPKGAALTKPENVLGTSSTTDALGTAAQLRAAEKKLLSAVGTRSGFSDHVDTSKAIGTRLQSNADFERFAREVFDLKDVQQFDTNYRGFMQAYDKLSPVDRTVGLLAERWKMGLVNPLGLAMQQAVREEFGIQGARLNIPPGWAKGVERYQQYMPGLRAWARAQYEETQAYLAAKSLTDVTLWRGYAWKDNPPQGFTFDDTVRNSSMALQPASAFSAHADTALSFTDSGTSNNYRLLTVVRVPARDVFSLGATGLGSASEGEVILLGGERRVAYVGVNIPHGDASAAWYKANEGKIFERFAKAQISDIATSAAEPPTAALAKKLLAAGTDLATLKAADLKLMAADVKAQYGGKPAGATKAALVDYITKAVKGESVAEAPKPVAPAIKIAKPTLPLEAAQIAYDAAKQQAIYYARGQDAAGMAYFNASDPNLIHARNAAQAAQQTWNKAAAVLRQSELRTYAQQHLDELTQGWQSAEKTPPPFSMADFANAKLKALSIAEDGSETYTATLNGQKYAVKIQLENPNRQLDELSAEGAAYEISRITGMGDIVTPTFSFTFGGRDYIASTFVDGVKPLGETDRARKAFAVAVSDETFGNLLVNQYLMGDLDRHGFNTLYNKETGQAYQIDYARALGAGYHPNTGTLPDAVGEAIYDKHLAQAEAANRRYGMVNNTYGYRPDELVPLSAAVLRDVVAHESAIVDIMDHYGLDVGVSAIRDRISVLRYLLTLDHPTAHDLTMAAYMKDSGREPDGYWRQQDREVRERKGAPVQYGGPTEVTYASDAARERLSRGLVRTMKDEEVASLAGAPPGSRVEVGKYGDINVTAPDGTTSTVLLQSPDPGKTGNTLFLNDHKGSDGKEIPFTAQGIAEQVRTAYRLGFDHIRVKTRPGTDDPLFLPQLGFDTPIAQVLVDSGEPGHPAVLPPSLKGAKTLRDLLKTPEGVAWWTEYHQFPGLNFDLRRGTRGWGMLDAYLRAHGMGGL